MRFQVLLKPCYHVDAEILKVWNCQGDVLFEFVDILYINHFYATFKHGALVFALCWDPTINLTPVCERKAPAIYRDRVERRLSTTMKCAQKFGRTSKGVRAPGTDIYA